MPTTNHIVSLSRIIVCVALCLGIAACEVIHPNDQLIFESETIIPPKDTTATDPTVPSNIRTALLIDFSGWRCVNCPDAAEQAHELLSIYGQQLVVLEAHPAANKLTASQKPDYNYTCPAADSLYKTMGGNNTTPLPIGSVNMKAKEGGTFLMNVGEWAGAVQSAVKQYHSADIHLRIGEQDSIICNIYNWSDQTLACNLYVWLTEDSIVSAQYFPDSLSTNYMRNHLLRDAISSPNGEPLTLPAEENVTRTFLYTLPDKVVPENCHIVAALYANGEIIQAAQTEIH